MFSNMFKFLKHVIYTYYLTQSFMYLRHYKIQTLKVQMQKNKLRKITPKATKISLFYIHATFLSVTSSES
jgi:hypothetical protein